MFDFIRNLAMPWVTKVRWVPYTELGYNEHQLQQKDFFGIKLIYSLLRYALSSCKFR